MYVMQIRGSDTINALHKAADSEILVPADRVIFNTIYNETEGQYVVNHLGVFAGSGSDVVIDLTLSAGSLEATLGYIGKSGRFVALTN